MGNRTMQRLAASLAVSVMAALLATATTGDLAFAGAPSGQDIPPAARIVDAGGNIWTVVHGKLYRNGVPDTAAGRVARLRYYNGRLFRKTCFWYKLKTTKWPAGDNGWQMMPTNPAGIMQDCPDYFRHHAAP